jgi:hypothetical protein
MLGLSQEVMVLVVGLESLQVVSLLGVLPLVLNTGMGGVVSLRWRGGTTHALPFMVLVLLQVEGWFPHSGYRGGVCPLLTDVVGESKGKEPRRIHAYTPHQIIKRKSSKSLQENRQEKAPKITKKERTGTTHPSLEEPHRIIYTSQRGSYKV